jgi:serine/threonine-protein kinase
VLDHPSITTTPGEKSVTEFPLFPGHLLAGRYRLLSLVGAGGMSVIWRGYDEVLRRSVALKVLAPQAVADARRRTMVRDEARATAQLDHPHVTQVHDYGEAVAGDGSIMGFVVYELLDGESVENRLAKGPLPWITAVEILVQVAEACAAAHELDIVHRDITPGNVMLTSSGVKVLDFGIATTVGAPDEDEDGMTFGTPEYVAPERLDGAPAHAATDVYALGVLLYEMLMGEPPFRAANWDDLATIQRSDLPPLPRNVAGLPLDVARLCQSCLDKEPTRRPSAQVVVDRLRPFMTTPCHPVATRSDVNRTVPRTVPAPAAAGHAAPKWSLPRPVIITGAGAITAVAVAAVVVALSLSDRSNDRVTEPPIAVGSATPGPAPSADVTAGPSPSADAPSPTAKATSTSTSTGRPSPTPTRSGASPSPTPSPSATVTVTQAVANFRQLVDAGLSAGAIHDPPPNITSVGAPANDVASDLKQIANNLRGLTGDAMVSGIANLHRSVDERANTGVIEDSFVPQLHSAINAIANAAGITSPA